MKVFLTLNPKKDCLSQIKLAKEIGFDGVEIVLEEKTKDFILSHYKKLRKLLNELNLDVSFHFPYWLNILNEEDLREIKKLYEIVKFFKSFGVIHIFAENEKEIENYNNLQKFFKNKNLYLENLFQRVELLENIFILNLKFVIDISHFLTVNTFSKFKDFLIKYKNKIYHFHFSDNNGMSHSHLPLGKGVLPIKKIIEFLIENFNDKTISFEIFETKIPKTDFEISLKIFKNVINKYGKK